MVGIEERGDNLGRIKAPTLQPGQIEAVSAVAFDPEGLARGGGEGAAVGPGTAVHIGGRYVEAEAGFAAAGLAGDEGEEAG